MTLKAADTARRNLMQRLDRTLAALETRPGRREGDHLLKALSHLQAGAFDEGERDVLWAEWASRQPDAVDPHPTVTPQELRAQFAAIVARFE